MTVKKIQVSKMSTKSLLRKLKPAFKKIAKENESVNGTDWSKFHYDRTQFCK